MTHQVASSWFSAAVQHPPLKYAQHLSATLRPATWASVASVAFNGHMLPSGQEMVKTDIKLSVRRSPALNQKERIAVQVTYESRIVHEDTGDFTIS